MVPEKPRRAFLRLGTGVALSSIAGCTTRTDSTTPTDSSSPSAPTQTTVSTPTQTPTHEPIGTGSNPSDLGIVNRSEKVQRITVDVTPDGESEKVFTETMEIKPSVYYWRDIFPQDAYSGTYFVTVHLQRGTKQTYKWNLSKEPAEGWLYIYVESDDTVSMTYTIA